MSGAASFPAPILEMQVGNFYEQIVIEQRASVTGSRGPTGSTWSTLATVWAQVKPMSAREAARSGQQEPVTEYTVTTHYRSDVTAAMRITWGSRTLQIIAPPTNPDMRQRFTEIRCRETAD